METETNTITIVRPDDSGMKSRNIEIADQAAALKIDSNDAYEAAARFLREIIVPIRKAIKDTFAESKQAADHAHKVVCAAEKTHLEKVAEAEQTVKAKMGIYHDEVERRRREQEEAQRRSREEAERKERKARAEAERKAREETERRRKEEEDKRIAEAQKLEEEGKAAEADKVLDAPVHVEEVVPEPVAPVEAVEIPTVQAPPKAAGVSSRETWHAEVTDLMLLVKAVAEGKAGLECLQANQSILNQKSKIFKAALDIPGVKAVSESKMAVR